MSRPPYAVIGASAIETAEGLVVAGLGLFAAVSAVAGTPGTLGGAFALAAFGLLAGAGMIAVAVGLLRQRRWSRAPAIVTQVLAVPVGVSLLDSGRYAAGVPLVAVAVAGLALLFAEAFLRPR